MARAVVGTPIFANGNPVTSISFTMGATPTVGNVLFVTANVNNSSATFTMPATWTEITSVTDSANLRLKSWKYVVQSGATTTLDHLGNAYTVTSSASAALDGFAAEIADGDPGASLVTVSAHTGGTTAFSLASGNIVVAENNSIVLGYFGASGLCSASTYTSGWTSAQANARCAQVRRTSEPTAASTIDVTRTWTTNQRHAAFLGLVIPPYVAGTDHTRSVGGGTTTGSLTT